MKSAVFFIMSQVLLWAIRWTLQPVQPSLTSRFPERDTKTEKERQSKRETETETERDRQRERVRDKWERETEQDKQTDRQTAVGNPGLVWVEAQVCTQTNCVSSYCTHSNTNTQCWDQTWHSNPDCVMTLSFELFFVGGALLQLRPPLGISRCSLFNTPHGRRVTPSKSMLGMIRLNANLGLSYFTKWLWYWAWCN